MVLKKIARVNLPGKETFFQLNGLLHALLVHVSTWTLYHNLSKQTEQSSSALEDVEPIST